MPLWLDELLAKVEAVKPDFFALHCQEVGGKSQGAVQPREVDDFIDKLIARLRERAYDRSLCVVDTDSRNEHRYTALGSFYFVRKCSTFDAASWNFYERRFDPLRVGVASVYSGCVDDVQYAQKERFTPDLYPLCRWSRKGFIHTRWQFRVSGDRSWSENENESESENENQNDDACRGERTLELELELDLVNVHLFHDVCNLVALEHSPSIYSQYRANGLRYTLNRCRDAPADRPLLVFGDFNFRLDSHALLEQLTSLHHLVAEPHLSTSPSHEPATAKRVTAMRYRRKSLVSDDSKPLLEVAEKRFKLVDSDNLLRSCVDAVHTRPRNQMLPPHRTDSDDKAQLSDCTPGDTPESNISVSLVRPFDGEPRAFDDTLCELPISFAPTYPLSEKADEPGCYMPTRCPSWCDRILLSHSAAELLLSRPPEAHEEQPQVDWHAMLQDTQAQYDILGRHSCTGDHKPVFLAATMRCKPAP